MFFPVVLLVSFPIKHIKPFESLYYHKHKILVVIRFTVFKLHFHFYWDNSTQFSNIKVTWSIPISAKLYSEYCNNNVTSFRF